MAVIDNTTWYLIQPYFYKSIGKHLVMDFSIISGLYSLEWDTLVERFKLNLLAISLFLDLPSITICINFWGFFIFKHFSSSIILYFFLILYETPYKNIHVHNFSLFHEGNHIKLGEIHERTHSTFDLIRDERWMTNLMWIEYIICPSDNNLDTRTCFLPFSAK